MTRRRRIPSTTVALVGAGGAAGALARYGIAHAIPTARAAFPWATFAVNVTGSFALGALLTLLVERLPRGRAARPLLGTGVIGAYTTFSTFTVEAVLLARNGHAATAALYVVTSVVAGLLAAAAGIALVRGAVRTGPGSAGTGR